MLSLLLASLLTFVELNCENLFDCTHDDGKNDYEFLPDATRRWDSAKYWRKVNDIAREIIACGGEGQDWALPDLVALTEVENDSVMHALLKKSPLKESGYEYLMTHSDDERGIDVALVYSPFSFRPLGHHSLRVSPPEGHHATRDILYVPGVIAHGDTLHVFVVHAPSRVSGERVTRPYRQRVADRLNAAVDSIRQTSDAHIIISGDFNDYAEGKAFESLYANHLHNVSRDAHGSHGARGTYKHRGRWASLDHILVSNSLLPRLDSCYILDLPHALEEDEKYGGCQPRRTYIGMRYHRGVSDHLPLVARFKL